MISNLNFSEPPSFIDPIVSKGAVVNTVPDRLIKIRVKSMCVAVESDSINLQSIELKRDRRRGDVKVLGQAECGFGHMFNCISNFLMHKN